jgi:hypothetical protein
MSGRVDLWPDILTPLAKYLRGYPTVARPRQTSDFFYWSLAEFGLRPVFRINHVVVHATGRTSGPLHVVLVKQLYASHYFRTALEDATDLAGRVRAAAHARSGVRVLGPAPAPLGRLRGEHRFQFFIKSPSRAEMRGAVRAALAARPDLARRVTIDVDPLSVL